MQYKLVNHDLHYNHMKHMRSHQISQKQIHGMSKYDQKPTETQLTHVRMKCYFDRPCKGLFYTCKMDIQYDKTTYGQRL
mgnify:CR=1 FL=1